MRKQLIINSMDQQIRLSGETDAEALRERLAIAAITCEVVTVQGVNGNSLTGEVDIHLRPSLWIWWTLMEVREEDIGLVDDHSSDL